MNNIGKLGQKIAVALFISNSFFSASIIISFTVGAIVVVQLAGNSSRWTGVPSTLILVGAALVAYPMGRLMDRAGRRIGLSLGYVFGISGALMSGIAIVEGSLPIFLLGILLIGLTKGVIDMGRYAAAEASPPGRRGRAISLVVLGGTVGAIIGPSLIDATNNLAIGAGLPDLSGPWFAAVILFIFALIIINLFLRPDPREIARQLAALEPNSPSSVESNRPSPKKGRTFQEIFREPAAKLAIGSMVFGQLAMVLVMTVTPIHMHGHQHPIASISWVIMAHTLGMFGLSFVSGWLADKFGRARIILAGGLILTVACLTAPLSTGVPGLAVVLFLLGLGWNFCFVAGSTLLDDILKHHEKGRIQGSIEAMINLSSGLGSISSGFIFAAAGFAVMSWATILVAMVPITLVVLSGDAGRKVPLEGTAPS